MIILTVVSIQPQGCFQQLDLGKKKLFLKTRDNKFVINLIARKGSQ